MSGTCLVVRRSMTGATGNVYVGLHEFSDMAFVLHLLRPGDVFLDVGANVGSYTVLAAGASGASVVAFEPDPKSAADLARNVAANSLEDRVTVRVAAVGASSGSAFLTVGAGPENRIAASGQSVDLVMHATCMKLDVEGHETAVLEGAARLLSDPRLLAVAIEDDRASEILVRAGFERVGYDPWSRRLTEATRSANALFVRDRVTVTQRLRTAPAFTVLGWSI